MQFTELMIRWEKRVISIEHAWNEQPCSFIKNANEHELLSKPLVQHDVIVMIINEEWLLMQ